MKNSSDKTPYILLAVVYILWCFVVSELMSSKVPLWLSLLAATGGFFGWLIIYRLINNILKNNRNE